MSSENRKPLYAKIAIARKQLPHLDEEAYRELLDNNFGTRSASKLTWRQLQNLVQMLADMGAVYATKERATKRPGKNTHARTDFYSIANDQYGPIKRKICAIWKGLGYDMQSLDTRCKREFGVESFAWLRDRQKLQRLLLDVEAREHAKHATEWHEATKAECE